MKLLDVVALTRPLPELHLAAGQVGTIVEELAADVFEVEFADLDGRAYAVAPVAAADLLVLRHEAQAA